MLTTWQSYNRIGRPLEAHNAPTADEYRRVQASIISRNASAYPGRNWRSPFASLRTVLPFINAGRWVVICPECGNAPSYDPDWQLACCCECGATFNNVAPPDGWVDAEAVMMQRPSMVNRNWQPSLETLADIGVENTQHGIAEDA